MADGAVAVSAPVAKKPRASTPKVEKHTLTIHFTEPEDISLYEKLESDAKADRRQLGQFALLKLHELFENDPSPNGKE
jgi:hypothetical protein